MLKQLLLPLLLLTFLVDGTGTWGQELSIVDIDVSAFPTVTGDLLLVDNAGQPQSVLVPSLLSVTDFGTVVHPSDITIDCPPPSQPRSVSLVLLLDRSGSMGLPMPQGNRTRIQALKLASEALVRSLSFMQGTAVAVTAFDDLPSVVCGFQSAPAPLLSAINRITPGAGTDYNPPYLDPIVGALGMLRARPSTIRRVIVFISDGEPTTTTLIDSIAREATRLDVSIHTVTIGGPPSGVMKDLAERTGGTPFGNVVDAEEMQGLLRLLALKAQGREVCKISWRAPLSCVPSGTRQVIARIDTPAVSTTTSYRPPAGAWVRLTASPSYVDFGDPSDPETIDRTVTITATGTNFLVSKATITDDTTFAVVDWQGGAPPFTLRNGESRAITVRFAPQETSLHFATLVVDGLPCSPPAIPLIGGSGDGVDRRGLVLVAPRGGENYSGCDSVPIQWRGVADTMPIDIDYSSDNGITWSVVARRARSLGYMWMPPAHSDQFRVRISSRNGALDTISRVAGGGASQRDTLATFMEFRSPVGVAVDETYLYIAEAGRHRVRRVALANGYTNTIAGSGTIGYGGDGGPAAASRLANPNDLAIDRSQLYIADYSNNRVRRIDLGSGIITTVAGNGLSGFSGDGGAATSANLFHPSHLALWRNNLYLTDRDNYRIRRVDLTTGIITTVAGGGSNPLGDGGPATDARLTHPADIAIVDDTLFLAEEESHRIRAMSLATGRISTLAGDNGAGWYGDGGPAAQAQLNRPTGLTSTGRFLVIADEGNNALRLVDRFTRRIYRLAGGNRAGFSGDNGDARRAFLDSPEGLATGEGCVYVADVNNDVVRRIALPDPATRDSSVAPFAVSQPSLAIDPPRRTIVFGATAVDAARDSALLDLVCNNGNSDGIIEQARIIGRDSNDFVLVSPLSGATVGRNECRSIEIRFAPSGIASRRALIALGSDCFGYDTIALWGTGTPTCGGATIPTIDMGRLETADERDSTVVSVLCNHGAATLSGTISLADNEGAFSIVAGEGRFTLEPGACLAIRLRFAPQTTGPHTARLDFGLPGECGHSKSLVVGVGYSESRVSGPATFLFPVQHCYGSPVDSSVLVVNNSELDATITSATILPADDVFTLLDPPPSATAPLVIPPGSSHQFNLRFSSASPGTFNALLQLSGPSTTSLAIGLVASRDSAGIAPEKALLLLGPGSGATAPFAVDSVRVTNTGTLGIDITAASFQGSDPGRFVLVSPALPLRIPAGEGRNMVVGATAVNDGSPIRGRLLLTTQVACVDTAVIELIQEGNAGLARFDRLDTLRIFCPDVSRLDTFVRICNPVQAPLAIDSIWIDGADAQAFRIDATGSVPVASESCSEIPLAFLPDRSGLFTARLHIRHDGIGDTAVDVIGWHGLLDLVIDEDSIFAGPVHPGQQDTLRVRFANRGTRYGRLRTVMEGNFTIASHVPDVLQPGEGATIAITASSTQEGRHVARLILETAECGQRDTVVLVLDVVPSIRARLILPCDSAPPGTRIALAIRAADLDVLRSAGIDSFRIGLQFDGLVLWPRFAVGGRASIQPLRPDGAQPLTVAGAIPAIGDTLATILCDVLSGARKKTALAITSVDWPGKVVETDSVDGLFIRLEGCGPAQFASRPLISRLRPIPARAELDLEIDLAVMTDVRLEIVDIHGTIRSTIPLGRMAKGAHIASIDVSNLEAGNYVLVVNTPLGLDGTRIVIME